MFDPLRKTAFGRFAVAGIAKRSAPPVVSCYALSDVDGAIATSLLGPRATFPCGDVETFYAISDVDGSIASASGGERATFDH